MFTSVTIKTKQTINTKDVFESNIEKMHRVGASPPPRNHKPDPVDNRFQEYKFMFYFLPLQNPLTLQFSLNGEFCRILQNQETTKKNPAAKCYPHWELNPGLLTSFAFYCLTPFAGSLQTFRSFLLMLYWFQKILLIHELIGHGRKDLKIWYFLQIGN